MLAAIFLRRTGRISADVDAGLLKLTVDVLIPCLIIDKVLKTNAFSNAQNLYLPPLLGFSLTCVAVLIGLAVAAFVPARQTGLATRKQKRTFAACVGLLNYGYVPIPLIAALFPNDDRTMGVLFLQYLGAEISVWTVVLIVLTGKFGTKAFWNILNAPILSILIAVPLNLLGHSPLIPAAVFDSILPFFQFLSDAVHAVGLGAIPISLLMVGLTISELVNGKAIQQRRRTAMKTAFWSVLVRLAVMPSIFMILAVTLPVTIEIKRVLVIHGSMGSAIFPIVLSRYYNGNPETAFDTVMSNTLVSLLTLPLWIAFGLYLIGNS
jgi:predicted permease